MKRKILAAGIIAIILASLFLLQGIAMSSMDTPPPYRFLWELKIVDENESTVVLEIENVSVAAHRGKGFVDITNVTSIPLTSLLILNNLQNGTVLTCNGAPVTYPFLHTPVRYRDVDADGALTPGDRIIINRSGLRMNDYLNFSMIVVTGYPWERLKCRFGVFGADVADAKIPPTFVELTPEIIEKIYDKKRHTIQIIDEPYSIYMIHDLKHHLGCDSSQR